MENPTRLPPPPFSPSARPTDGDVAHNDDYASANSPGGNTTVSDSRVSTSGSRPARRSSSTIATAAPRVDINLPYRTLSPGANLDEYRTETQAGEIPGPMEPNGERQYKLVTFLPGDRENPKNWSKAYKWYCTAVVSLTCFVVAFASSVITADIPGVMETFDVSEEVALVSISVFVVGFGIGKVTLVKALL